jgi:hypothetical protein
MARDAVEHADRPEQQARSERAELERRLEEERAAREAAELGRGRAQAALEVEKRSRAQLEAELARTQQRLDAAEQTCDEAIATRQQGARPARAPRRKR